MTIFGFNTDVKLGDVTYHVQTEARHSDLLLQSLVFVQGQCVAKRTFSYAHKVSQPDFSSDAIHELLKLQHKTVVEAIQSGQVAMDAASVEVQDVGGSGFALMLVSLVLSESDAQILMRLQVTDSGKAVSNARVTCWPCGSINPSPLAQGITGATGQADLSVPLTEEILRDSAVMMRATHAGKSATRKFRFKK